MSVDFAIYVYGKGADSGREFAVQKAAFLKEMQEFIAMDFGEVDVEMTDAVEAEAQAANEALLPVTVLSGFLGAPTFWLVGFG